MNIGSRVTFDVFVLELISKCLPVLDEYSRANPLFTYSKLALDTKWMINFCLQWKEANKLSPENRQVVQIKEKHLLPSEKKTKGLF